MSDARSFTDIDGQHVELLPARLVLSALGDFAPGGEADAVAVGGNGGNGGIGVLDNVNVLSAVDGGQSAASGGAGGLGFSFADASGGLKD